MAVREVYEPDVSRLQTGDFGAQPFRLRPIAALRALGKLIQNKDDTAQVFEIMRALSGKSLPKGYAKLLKTTDGGRIAFRHQELATVLSNKDYLLKLPEGSVGRAYLDFTTKERISAQGLIDESRKGIEAGLDLEHPFSWYGRRLRDVHDVWHVLTGYGRDALGEACLVAFSYAQTKSLGFALIAGAGALKLRRALPGQPTIGATWEAYRHGTKAKWLPGEDYISLLAEPLETARMRLGIMKPRKYELIPQALRNRVGAEHTFA